MSFHVFCCLFTYLQLNAMTVQQTKNVFVIYLLHLKQKNIKLILNTDENVRILPYAIGLCFVNGENFEGSGFIPHLRFLNSNG